MLSGAQAELGSVNPFVVLPPALALSAELAQGLAGAITMGCGQFCTSPGVIVVRHGGPPACSIAISPTLRRPEGMGACAARYASPRSILLEPGVLEVEATEEASRVPSAGEDG